MVRTAAVLVLVMLSAPVALSAQVMDENPAMAADLPDPSVVRDGATYWATATSAEWAPLFPILRSVDLASWQVVGAIFPRRPAWAAGNFWAPELWHRRDRWYAYYVGRRHGGPLCVAVATATTPTGPWTDHGPLVCQAAGSIDPVPTLDENGRPWLLWKEDGNSRGAPTPIWAQPLDDSGTRLTGAPVELLRNDVAWEKNLVEGPYVQRHGAWFYMFYSGSACCGASCDYALGVARARKLTGPWEKNPANPILAGNGAWRCPGHGSVVTAPDGRDHLVYHAYPARGFQFVGRQMMRDEVVWGTNGWPTINSGRGPSARSLAPHGVAGRDAELTVRDDFGPTDLAPGWQWPADREPTFRVGAGLALSCGGRDPLSALVARPAPTAEYEATVTVEPPPPGASAGLIAVGDAEHALGLLVEGRTVRLFWREGGRDATVGHWPLAAGAVDLRLTAHGGHVFGFAWRATGEAAWTQARTVLDGQRLPPWDRGVRIGLCCGGPPAATARFRAFALDAHRP